MQEFISEFLLTRTSLWHSRSIKAFSGHSFHNYFGEEFLLVVEPHNLVCDKSASKMLK